MSATTKQVRAETTSSVRAELSDPVAPPPRLRRRPVLVVGSVLVVCAGALVSLWGWASVSTATEVVAVRTTVHRGEVLTRDELTTVRVSVDPMVRTVPAGQLDQVVGQRAALDLAAESLLSPDGFSAAVLPGKGMSLVGVPLAAGTMPSQPLLAGDLVRIVDTPGTQGELTGTPAETQATVVGVRAGDTEQVTVVDVLVPSADAASLAARAATGKVALVLDSRER